MANFEFRLPDIGEGIAEGEIVRWMVKAGDAIKEEQEFVEVMTDKATVMITAPLDGKVVELRAKEGQVVPVESVIAVLEPAAGKSAPRSHDAHAKAPAAKAPPAPATKEAAQPAAAQVKPKEPAAPARKEESRPAPAARPQPARQPVEAAQSMEARQLAEPPQPVDAGKPADSRKHAGAQQAAAAPQPAAARQSSEASEAKDTNGAEPASPGKVLAAPATRRRAREMGIDLAAVAGTGPRGRVMNEDLNTFLSAKGTEAEEAPEQTEAAEPAEQTEAPAAPAGKPARKPTAATGVEERVPMRGLRKKIAEAMARSKRNAAHFTYVEEIDVTELVKLRNEAKALYKDDGVNVTYLPFIMKALVAGLRKFPWLNATLDEAAGEVVIKHWFNFGIATDTDNGLIVPVVKDVDRKSVVELASEIQELAARTREGKASIDDLQGSTFTITNAGNIGGLFATPVINYPEVAILGVHKIARRAVVKEEKIVIADVMYLSMSIDHRIVDGATGARCMNVIKELLENPRKLLLGSL